MDHLVKFQQVPPFPVSLSFHSYKVDNCDKVVSKDPPVLKLADSVAFVFAPAVLMP